MMRSNKKEFLDEENIPPLDLHQNLYELDLINRFLGGHKATIKGLKKVINISSKKIDTPLAIVDIGCGGGDTLKAIALWAKKNNIPVILIGVDIKEDAIQYARIHCNSHNNISFVCTDYRNLPQLNIQADIYINSLFCHHLSNEEIILLIQFMSKNAKVGFIINDLHRNIFAYYSIKWLTLFFSKSYLVKNDAPISVLRGFKQNELLYLTAQSGVPISIHWAWAFRWILIYSKKHGQV